MIRLATRSDIPQVVEVHRDALPGDFLPGLGAPFLQNRVYPFFFRAESCQLWVHADANKINGVLIYTPNTQRFSQEFRRFAIGDCIGLVGRSMQNRLLKDLLGLLISRTKLYSAQERDRNAFGEIVLLAVRPESQGRGIGSQLIQVVKNSLAQGEVSGGVVRTSEESAARFYEKCGFREYGEENRLGRKLALFELVDE